MPASIVSSKGFPESAMCGRLRVGKENLHQFEGRRLNGAPGTPFVSSNGVKDAVVWVVESNRFEDDDGGDSMLHAWNAVTGELLYSSPRTAAQNLGDGRKFSSIAVVKGKVLVGAASIACYGLKREDL